MATLRLSSFGAQAIIGSGAGCIGAISASTNASIITGSNSAGVSLLIIYKGTIETFPSFTDRSTRASDVLITFTLPTNAGFSDLGIVSDSYRLLVGKHLPNQAASASGTASWFLLCRAGTTSLTDKGALIGSVGIVGSGADLEISSTSIISANNYQSAGFYVNMPQNWTI
jgi:hypothetical protein